MTLTSLNPILRPLAWLTLASAALALSSCSPFERRLRYEREIPELNALGKAFDSLEPRTSFVSSEVSPGVSLRIAIHEVGPVESDRILVAVHGIVSDYRCWRYVGGGLGSDFLVWAPDLPGCGQSDAPKRKDLEPSAYSPTWLAHHLLEALRLRLAQRDRPARLTLAGHSLGGGVLLRLLGDEKLRREYSDVIDLIDGVVLFSPLDFSLSKADRTLLEIAKVNDFEMLLGTAVGVVRGRTAESIYRGAVDSDRVPYEELERTLEVLVDPARRHAIRWMLEGLHFDQTAQVDWDRSEEWVRDYKNIDIPCLLVWGEQDETLPRSSGHLLNDEIPESRLRIVRDAKHCLPIEEPRVCVDLIRRFVREDFSTWAATGTLDRPPPLGVAWSGEQQGLKPLQRDSVSRGHEDSAASSPSAVTVLSGKDIGRSGARYVSDALRLVPGAEVQRISSTESGVSFRGYVDSATATQGTLGLVDGRQVYNIYLGNVLWDQLAVRMDDISRVEIIRGPGSFIHGPNAMHGVVSIETKSPLEYEKDSVSARVAAGSYDSVVVGATAVRRTESTGFKVTAQHDDIDSFDMPSRGDRDKIFFESAFETEIDGDPEHVAGIQFGASQQDFDILLPSLEIIPPTVFLNRGQELFTTAKYRNGNPDERALLARLSWTGFDSESDPGLYYSPFTLDLDVFHSDLRVTKRFESHFLTAGAGFRHSTFTTDDTDISDGRHSMQEVWLFAQDEIRLTEDFSVTIGARPDYHSVTGATLAPRLAAVWEVVDGHYARASAGRGFRNPSLRELWFDMPVVGVPGAPAPIQIRGNDDVRAERLTSFELGYVGSWGPLFDFGAGEIASEETLESAPHFEAGITGFYNLVDDLISFESSPTNPLEVRPENQDDEEAFGFELEARYVFSSSLSTFANYKFTIRRDRETKVENELSPRNAVNVGIAFEKYGLTSMFWAHYYDETELFGMDIPSYVLLNGSVSYRFYENGSALGDVFVRAFNVLDRDHREHPQGDEYGWMITGGLHFDW